MRTSDAIPFGENFAPKGAPDFHLHTEQIEQMAKTGTSKEPNETRFYHKGTRCQETSVCERRAILCFAPEGSIFRKGSHI
ncbi:hypothetical protein M513_02071 [Trichuris suis]|uniref:Uncharacterized protein n=1 Tax=Trichuris suis TaxID=68888 RepID=A0A085MIZ0_9BILA|nr:hypothetical protein M513_02071 [Trichuris suis]